MNGNDEIEEEEPTFDHKLIGEILKDSVSSRVTTEGNRAVAEYMRLFIKELIRRANELAQNNEEEISPHHIEMILPELLLDF